MRLMLMPAAALLLLAVAGLVLAAHSDRLPPPTGPYAVGTRLLYLNDPARALDGSPANTPAEPGEPTSRPIVVQLWYPAAPSSAPFARYRRLKETTWRDAWMALIPTHSRWDAPVAPTPQPLPVLVYSPRWRGNRTQNTIAIEELASRGYLVAAVDHPQNAERMELADGSVIYGFQQLQGPKGVSASAAEQIAYWNQQLDVWAADMRLALDALTTRNADPNDPLHARLDLTRVGAWGHSFGGAAALRLCGLDPRITSAVNLDGWTFAGLDHRSASQQILLVYEAVSQQRERDLDSQPEAPNDTEAQMDREDFRLTRASLTRFGGLRVFVDGTQHADFSDEPILPPLQNGSQTGPIDPQRSQQVLRALLANWFGHQLHNHPTPLLDPNQHLFPEVHVESWPPRRREQGPSGP